MASVTIDRRQNRRRDPQGRYAEEPLVAPPDLDPRVVTDEEARRILVQARISARWRADGNRGGDLDRDPDDMAQMAVLRYLVSAQRRNRSVDNPDALIHQISGRVALVPDSVPRAIVRGRSVLRKAAVVADDLHRRVGRVPEAEEVVTQIRLTLMPEDKHGRLSEKDEESLARAAACAAELQGQGRRADHAAIVEIVRMSVPRSDRPSAEAVAEADRLRRTGSWDAISSEGYHPVAPSADDRRAFEPDSIAGRILTPGASRAAAQRDAFAALAQSRPGCPTPTPGTVTPDSREHAIAAVEAAGGVTAMVRRYDVGDDADDLFAPFPGADDYARDEVVGLLRQHPRYAEELWRSALSAAS